MKLQVARLPLTSVALQSTTVDPRLKFTPLRVEPAPGVAPESEYRTDARLQLSVTVGSQPVPVFVYTVPELMVILIGVEWQVMEGTTLSWTITVAVLEAEFPLLSVQVRVTVLVPRLLQVKAEGLTALDEIAQLSVELLSTSVAVIAAFPEAFSWTVMFLVDTVGAILSWTVTDAVLEAKFPLSSVQVRVTVLVPRLLQVKAEGLTTLDEMAQLSVVPLSTSDATMVALPEASSWMVIFLVDTVGAILS
jgi:hypothetical protein